MTQPEMKRVVVSGMGAVSPMGPDVAALWEGLAAGRRAIGRITKFDPTGLRNETGGQVWDNPFIAEHFGFDTAPDEATGFLLQATAEALADAGLEIFSPPNPRAGAVMSTNFGGALSWEDFCAAYLAGEENSAAFFEFIFHAALAHVSRYAGLGGPSCVLSIACASGAAAVGYAFDLIRQGAADVMLAGGHDSLAPSPLSGLSTLHTITAEDIRPFSADRSGTLFGEGAAVLVLESLEHARARGARIYCEVLGSWQNNNAYHLTAPDKGGAGMARVLRGCLDDAQMPAADVDYINAHGTGTESHDPAETEAIKSVLGEHARRIGVSSIKGAVAHLMGAAGAVEAVATVKALETGIMPPTVNYREPDPACDLDYVPNASREAKIRHALTISAGVGGSNACVAFGSLDAGRKTAAPAGRRAVITGMGPICAVGIGSEDFAEGLIENRDGRTAPQRLCDHTTFAQLAECVDFVVEDYLESEKTYLDRCSELTLAACHLAFRDAGLNWHDLDHPRAGLCVGTAMGCLDSMANLTARVQKRGVRFGSPVIFTHSFANSPTSLAAIEYDLQGPTSTFCTGDISAAAALDYARRIIADGRADVVIAGGVDALSAPLLHALAGIEYSAVPGEGACFLVLESEEHARARGAVVRGELAAVTLGAGSRAEQAAAAVQEAGHDAADVAVFAPRDTYGHTFGASLALSAAEWLLAGSGEACAISGCDPLGMGAGIVLRREQ